MDLLMMFILSVSTDSGIEGHHSGGAEETQMVNPSPPPT